ncbi:hypothetical protein M413DRAFT_350178 [Hebeloma cylindrosporum]|uniref:Uncharacterized protein n=1 Tax=Hebeloma cylindrosporum TaxID=76867 RepID=A0A0C3BV91_HEBCY|nr:hypothetical protein M413DRAFT_350178 [Hebeloma cylindrosporum h7]
MSIPRRRPPSSAVPRPTTSAAGRPTTAAGFSHQPQYFGNTHYEVDYEEEYEEESEDEDVFAFLPPTTADQEAATAAAAAAAAGATQQPVAGSSTSTGTLGYAMGGQSPYAVGGAGTAPAHESPASTSSSSPFSHSPFTPAPKRNSSLLPSSVPLVGSIASHSIPTYPDPTFDPWSRPAGAIPSSSAVSPYSHLQLASNNPYSPTNPYAATSDPYATTTRPPTHPLSPPSPSTDSHPSTGVSGITTGQELFKLKRLTSARVEEEPEPEEQLGVEEYEREGGREGVIRESEAKEVRVNLPVLAGSKAGDESGARIVARARRKSSAIDDDVHHAKTTDGAAENNDDDDEEESGEADEENTVSPDGTNSKRTRKRRQRSKKTKSKISTSTDGLGSVDAVLGATTTGVNPHVGSNASLNPSSAAVRSVGMGVPDTPGNAERGYSGTSPQAGHGFGFGQRMKNPNAQPYYAYAAMANAYGRGASRATTAQTRGTSRTPATATTATAAGTLSANRRSSNEFGRSYSQSHSHNRHPGDDAYVSDDASYVARAKRGSGGGHGGADDGDSFSMSGVSGISGYYPDEIGRGGRWDDDREGSIK